VLRSVLLLMDDPEINSPANVDAGVLYRDHRPEYDSKAKELVARTLVDVPEGSRMPTSAELTPAPVKQVDDDADFWNMTDDDNDFGGSDSDMDDFDDEDDQDEDDDLDMKRASP
jgi:ubiquitin-conjugating enzyme E2 R